MSNLFWGVSDALDLYGEYINAKRQIAQKTHSTAKKSNAQEHSIQKAEDFGEVAQGADHSKNSIENDQNKYSERAIDGKVEKDNSEAKGNDDETNSSHSDISSELNKNMEITKDVEKKEVTEHQNINDTVELQKMKKDNSLDQKENEISESVLSMPNKTACQVNEHNTGIENLTENQNEVVDTLKNTKQMPANSTENKEIPDADSRNPNSSKEVRNYFTNLAIDIADSSYSKIHETEELTTNHTESTDNNNLESTELRTRKAKLDYDMKKNCFEKEPSNMKTNANECTERQNAGEDPIPEQALPNLSKDTSSPTFKEEKPNILNILIYGGGDPRHIIKTIAKRYTHYENEGTASSLPILKFYIIDGCIEIVARNIVLLGIALERPELISLRNKVHLFMDIYGNSLLRPICHQYLISKSITLLKMVSDSETLAKIAPIIHIDKLKYREIDALQDAFEFWQPKPGYDFNIKDYWMSRLRRLLAVRYDAREGVFDWDLNMSLKDRGGQQICSQEYRYWRETGIAFTFPEYEQCKPNKTLSAGLVRNGGRYLHRGYIGDIQTGPFCTFGLRSLEERMHHSAHGENDYRATDITERNLLEYFHEIQNGTPYVHNNELSHKYGGVRFQMGERLIHNECDMKGICAYDQPWINVEGIEVHFLPLHEIHEIGKGTSKWDSFFDIAFIGYKYFDFVENSFPKVLRENSLIIFETKLRSVEIKNRIVEFESELQEYARDAKFLSVINYNALNSKNSILKFWKAEK